MVGPRRRPNGTCLRTESGFSLVELLVSMIVAIVVVGGAALMAGLLQTRYRSQMEAAGAQQEGRYILALIERYLRAAGNNPYRLLTTPCPVAGTPVQALRFDPDGDGVHDDIRVQMDANPTNGLIGGAAGACNEANEDVTIAHDGVSVITLLDNVTGGGPVPQTDDIVTALRFVYRNPQRVVTTNPGAVAFIETQVTVRSKIDDPNLGAPVTAVVSSEVRMRIR